MLISAAFPGSYLKAQDLQGRTIPVTIADCRMEDLGGEEKPVLYFEGKERGLVLNKTNASFLVDAYGDETSQWRGRPIELYPARVQFQGRMVDAIRVRVPAPPLHQPAPGAAAPAQPQQPAMQPNQAASMAAQAPAQPAADQPFDDDIPF